MSVFTPDGRDLQQFEQDGFFIANSLLDAEEVELLSAVARADARMAAESYSRADGEGGAVRLHLRNDPGDDDIYAAIARSERVVNTMEKLLGGEVYHYHQKMILKEPKIGGAWAWHQDYGYWYNNGCLFPLLASCLIAVDRATRENGCLQVLRGSQRMGRIDHGRTGEQTGADPEQVAAARERLELIYVELAPGDAVFFHCNLLHRSDQNRSDQPRWAFICCYNAARNDPYKESRHPRYTPLEKWPDERIKEIGRRQREAMKSASP